MNFIFSISSLLVLPFWFLMIFLPTWRWTKRIMQSLIVIVPVALLYSLLVIPGLTSIFPILLNPSLEKMLAVLSTEAGTTISWIHFLAFDLFVGRWAYLDAREKNLSPLLMAPILFLILMLGPLGFILYMLFRRLGKPQSAAPA